MKILKQIKGGETYTHPIMEETGVKETQTQVVDRGREVQGPETNIDNYNFFNFKIVKKSIGAKMKRIRIIENFTKIKTIFQTEQIHKRRCLKLTNGRLQQT